MCQYNNSYTTALCTCMSNTKLSKSSYMSPPVCLPMFISLFGSVCSALDMTGKLCGLAIIFLGLRAHNPGLVFLSGVVVLVCSLSGRVVLVCSALDTTGKLCWLAIIFLGLSAHNPGLVFLSGVVVLVCSLSGRVVLVCSALDTTGKLCWLAIIFLGLSAHDPGLVLLSGVVGLSLDRV